MKRKGLKCSAPLETAATVTFKVLCLPYFTSVLNPSVKVATGNDKMKTFVPEKRSGKATIVLWEGEKIGWGRGPRYELFITDQRLAFIKLKEKKSFLRRAWEACSDNIDEALKNEESFEVPISRVTEAKVDTIMMTPYMRVRFQTDSGEKVFSFIFVASMTQDGTSPTAIIEYKKIAKLLTNITKISQVP